MQEREHAAQPAESARSARRSWTSRRRDLLASTPIGLALESRGLIDLGSLVTHRFGLCEVDAAFAALRDKPDGFIKAIVEP